MEILNTKGFSLAEVLIIVVVVGALGGVGATVYTKQKSNKKEASITNFDECVTAGNPVMESYPEQCSANGQTFTKDVSKEQKVNNGYNTRVTSGLKGFSVIVPDGWKGLLNTQDSDMMILPGDDQQEIKIGTKPVIEEVKGFGSDGPVILSIILMDGKDVYVPDSEPENVTFKLSGEPYEGKKYSLKYEEDSTGEGIGGRLKGDRDYYYIFDIRGGKKLSVFYGIYGSDPRNEVSTIEDIISTIKIN